MELFDAIKSRAGIPVQDPFAMLFSASAAKEQTVTGVPPLQFFGYGEPLISYQIYGNMTQNGTPTPSDPIFPAACGDLTAAGAYAGKYAVPITCGGETKTVYLDEPLRKIGDYADEVKSDGTAVRKIKKIVLDGTENWQPLWGVLSLGLSTAADTTPRTITVMCDRYHAKSNLLQAQGYPSHYGDCSITFRDYQSSLMIRDDRYGTDTAAYKSYLADQYAAGTPVTIWYVLAEDQAEAVTLPQIPTISGQNTLSFETALQPSSVSVTGHIKHVTS